MAAEMGVIWEGMAKLIAAIEAKSAAVNAAGEKVVRQGSAAIQQTTKPLTPVRSGTLRRSLSMTQLAQVGLGTWQSHTAPTTAYGRRIELGFHGVDSLGRHYEQNGHPYLTPGLAAALPKIAAIQQAVYAAALQA